MLSHPEMSLHLSNSSIAGYPQREGDNALVVQQWCSEARTEPPVLLINPSEYYPDSFKTSIIKIHTTTSLNFYRSKVVVGCFDIIEIPNFVNNILDPLVVI